MKRIASSILVILLALGAVAQSGGPVAVLQSDADLRAKQEACRTLARDGGPEAVPALEALLSDARLSHMARYALEGMPAEEAGAALRRALPVVDDALKLGIMSSLAARGDQDAVPPIVRVLVDGNPQLAAEAARALGRLIPLDAEVDIADIREEPGALTTLAPSLLHYAERMLEAGELSSAASICDALRSDPRVPAPVQAGALRGAILARGVEGVPILLETLHTDDLSKFDAAIRAALEAPGGDVVTGALGNELAKLSDWAKLAVLQVIGARGGSAAGPAVMALAREGNPEIRVAALQALTRMGYAPALPLMEDLTWNEDEAIAQAAQDGLIYFPGDKGDGILLAMLDREEAKTRLAAVDLISRGGLSTPLDPLMSVASTDPVEAVRVAALKGLRSFAGVEQLPALLDRLLNAESTPERQAAENALKAICQREKKSASASIEIRKAVYGDLPDGASKDVTGKVAALVEQGAMSIEASNANFGDAAPGTPKALRVDYTVNGTPMHRSAKEGETVALTAAQVPDAIVTAFAGALTRAEGDTKLAVVRLLGETGSPKALASVTAMAEVSDAATRDTARRVLCAWPTVDALPVVMDLASTADDQSIGLLALRGAMRLLNESAGDTDGGLAGYARLLNEADTPDERKLLLSGLARVGHPGAFAMALGQAADDAVRAEATQAAIAIAKGLGDKAREEASIGAASNWKSDAAYWRIEDGVVIGHSASDIPRNEYIWSVPKVGDFYLDLDVKLEPNTSNAGIQFRSSQMDEHGQAQGYQADVGEGYWGRLYHEHGRGMLDATDKAEAAVKPGEWNRYEILAVGPAIWTAINGTLGVALFDTAASAADMAGQLALQIHSGPPQKVQYRLRKLVHDPEIALSNQDSEALIKALHR